MLGETGPAAGQPEEGQLGYEGFAEQGDSPSSASATLRNAFQALTLVARLHHVPADPDHLVHQLGRAPGDVFTAHDLLLAARHLGLRAKSCRTDVHRLPLTPLPALAIMRDGAVAVLARADAQRVLLQRFAPGAQPRPLIEPVDAFAEGWTGELILITSRASLAGELARFDFSWFIPSLVKHRRLLGEVLLVSMFLQLFALVSPLFFQVVMDKVLVHHGTSTLNVIALGLVTVVVFESVLTALRAYLIRHQAQPGSSSELPTA